jgi:RNA-directed DNA polymerase
MIDYFETKSQPITKAMVWKAYGNVRSNKDGAGEGGMNWAKY